MYWLWYIIIGIAAGYFASLLVRGSGSGLLVNLIAGIIGGVIGGWLFSVMGVQPDGRLGSLITSTMGAIILLLLVGLFARR